MLEKTRTKVVHKNVSQDCKKSYNLSRIFVNSRKDRRKEGFFVRCRRTYVLNKVYA